MAADKDKSMEHFHSAFETVVSSVSLMVVEFDFASDSVEACSQSNWGQSPDSNKPNKGYFEDFEGRTNIEVAVSLAVESFVGLRNDGDMESCDH